MVSVAFSPELLDRYHGDAHVRNCFLPPEGNGMRLFDRDSWCIGAAWRGRCSIDRYHAALVAHGCAATISVISLTTIARRARNTASRILPLSGEQLGRSGQGITARYFLIMRPLWQEAINIPR